MKNRLNYGLFCSNGNTRQFRKTPGLLLFLFGAILLFSCRKEAKNEWQELDLLQYGIPISILAPDSTQVRSDILGGLIQDVTVKGGEDYSIQIYASSSQTNDIAKVKAGQLAEVKANRYFSKIIREEEDGFLYEIAIDSSNINYGFRLIRLQADKEYIFQTGLIEAFNLEQVEKMYAACKHY